ncbi:MAG: Tm-1-like ATP-binding domain-containing protein [Selenomonadaceae bacterium]|nr:Tm-1-like ATP-binding domain-containing protein [Selenomonadaceae bacterium]
MPQVVSVGACDMGNFDPSDILPKDFTSATFTSTI